MVSKSFVQSFSYQKDDAETVETAARLAKSDNVSFSQLILRLLKEEVRKKNAVGSDNPLNISYGKPEDKPLQSDLRMWIQTVHEHKDNLIMLSQIENISKSCAATARSYINQGRRYRK